MSKEEARAAIEAAMKNITRESAALKLPSRNVSTEASLSLVNNGESMVVTVPDELFHLVVEGQQEQQQKQKKRQNPMGDMSPSVPEQMLGSHYHQRVEKGEPRHLETRGRPNYPQPPQEEALDLRQPFTKSGMHEKKAESPIMEEEELVPTNLIRSAAIRALREVRSKKMTVAKRVANPHRQEVVLHPPRRETLDLQPSAARENKMTLDYSGRESILTQSMRAAGICTLKEHKVIKMNRSAMKRSTKNVEEIEVLQLD